MILQVKEKKFSDQIFQGDYMIEDNRNVEK